MKERKVNIYEGCGVTQIRARCGSGVVVRRPAVYLTGPYPIPGLALLLQLGCLRIKKIEETRPEIAQAAVVPLQSGSGEKCGAHLP